MSNGGLPGLEPGSWPGRKAAKQDITRNGSAVENKVKGGKVCKKVPPELRIHGRSIGEIAKLDPVVLKGFRLEEFPRLFLGKKSCGTNSPAYLNEEVGPFPFHAQFGEKRELCSYLEVFHQVVNDCHVQVDEFLETAREYFCYEVDMVFKVGGICVGGLDGFQVLVPPAALIADPDLADTLQSQALFPDRDCYPKRTLIILEAVPADPGRTPGKLYFIQYDHDVGRKGPAEETGKRAEIGSISRYDHRASIAVFLRSSSDWQYPRRAYDPLVCR